MRRNIFDKKINLSASSVLLWKLCPHTHSIRGNSFGTRIQTRLFSIPLTGLNVSLSFTCDEMRALMKTYAKSNKKSLDSR